MGCLTSKDALLKVDDSVQVGLKRAKTRPNEIEGHQGYVPPTRHPLIRMKTADSSLPTGDPTTVEGIDNLSNPIHTAADTHQQL
jgi:hypothetical protein